ncbi:MAG TPA: BMP family ABC transporter substrate-binding protein [Desulfatiglandales bacterium]|nr:BMP family ABC transporter substrate-binding protein [Desulfatiglandales bacterium]
MNHSKMLRVSIFTVAMLVLGLVMIPGAAQAALKGKVAVVLDVGGRGDLSFNDMGFKGTDKAAADFGLQMVEIQSASAADYLPNVRNAARSGSFDLIISVGFLLSDAVATASKEYPDQKFMIIDSVVDAPNVMSIIFKENEGSALVGALAAMVAAHYGYPYVGAVLGIEIPVLYHFEAGYRFGIDWGNKAYAQKTGKDPRIGLLYTYTGTFSDIAKGKGATEAMLAQKAGLIYNIAGPLGIGDLQAITEAIKAKGKKAGPPYMIGVDANQDWMGDGHRVLVSMLKRVDNACYNAVETVVKGSFKAGLVIMGLDVQGVAMSKDPDLVTFMEFGIGAGKITAKDKAAIVSNWKTMRAQIPAWIWDEVADLEKQIISGTISVPNANTVEEMKAVRAKYPLMR